MYQQHYTIPKSTGTLSDLLLAFGVAQVLREFVHHHTPSAQVMLRDAGACYVVDCGVEVEESWLDETPPFEPIPFLESSKTKPADDLPAIGRRNVDDDWERLHQYNELRQQLREQEIAGDELEQQLADLAPKADWTVATYLGDYRMQAQNIHNDLVERWLRSFEPLGAYNVRTILALFAGLDADWDEIVEEWKTAAKPHKLADTVTASQLFSPYASKGQNRAKANKLTMGNEKSFWLLEYLKAVGLWTATAPTKATNANLRKTYVLAPNRLDMTFHQRVFDDFRRRLRNTGAVKQDCIVALLYAQVLLQHCIDDDRLAFLDDGPISNLVAGMGVATYQLLSANSYTLMNLSYLGLPDRMPHIQNWDDAASYVAVLGEHLERINAIDDETSEGYALLQLYRDFVSGNYLAPLFEFYTGYCNFLMSAIARNRFYVKPFSITNLRRLLTMIDDKKYAPILDDEGFRNVARAIRFSTLIPLYLGKQSRFEVRYGLGDELKRKGQYRDDLIQALGDFMHEYNDESMRVHQRTNGQARRKLISTQDINALVNLIDEYDAKTISSLLVAYGYARDPKTKDDELELASEENETITLPDVTLPDLDA